MRQYKCSDGTWVRSQLERTVWENALRQGGGQYEPLQVPYKVMVTKNYTPDIVLPNGMWVEVKGWFRPEDRVKMKHIRASHPNQLIGILFSKDNKVWKGGKLTYTGWADKYKFHAAVGDNIPPEWYNL